MNITSAQYVAFDGDNTSITVVVDGVTLSVPLVPGNRHYDEIMRQVAAGDLTILDAD
ncbi:hypothetical protein [Hyphomonas sp.]|uniref:hypothetical protein n=1 Tax=Hyphomonas sp. TaxID=87 RepID=UPI0025C0364A|nr:hypothetical protein [Hyphomonas sp.]